MCYTNFSRWVMEDKNLIQELAKKKKLYFYNYEPNFDDGILKKHNIEVYKKIIGYSNFSMCINCAFSCDACDSLLGSGEAGEACDIYPAAPGKGRQGV